MNKVMIDRIKNSYHLFNAESIDKAEDDIFWKRESLYVCTSKDEQIYTKVECLECLYLVIAYTNYLSMKNSGKEFYHRYDDYQYECKLGYMDVNNLDKSIDFALSYFFKGDIYNSTAKVLSILQELIKEN